MFQLQTDGVDNPISQQTEEKMDITPAVFLMNARQRESHWITKSIVMIVVLVRVNLFINLYAVSGFISPWFIVLYFISLAVSFSIHIFFIFRTFVRRNTRTSWVDSNIKSFNISTGFRFSNHIGIIYLSIINAKQNNIRSTTVNSTIVTNGCFFQYVSFPELYFSIILLYLPLYQ